MSNEFIYKGLLIRTNCKYFQAKFGDIVNYSENLKTSTATLEFPKSYTAEQVSNLTGLKLIGNGDIELESMGLPTRITQSGVVLNGLRLNKLTFDNHTINIIIVNDSESRVVQSYERTVIVVSVEDYRNPEFIKFLFYTGNLLYLRPAGQLPENWEIRNFPKIIVDSGIKNLESSSDTVFSLRRRYDDYVIREIDYQNQFILEARKRLEDYGVQLVRINKETSLVKTSYVQYQFVQTPVRAQHPLSDDIGREILNFHQPIEFVLHTNDMVLYHDFKNKYLNLDLLSNLTEFKTTSRYGTRYTAAVKWGYITEDFNQLYQPDDNSNFAYQCQFRCDMFFTEIKDSRFKFLEEINWELNQDKQRTIKE